MGIYDREYYRGSTVRAAWFSGVAPVVKGLIIANVAVFLLQLVAPESQRYVIVQEAGRYVVESGTPGATGWLQLDVSRIAPPYWELWRLVTYAFCHDPKSLFHIVWNMLFLYMFGRELEHLYGSKEFFRFYVAAGVLSGLAHVGVAYAGGIESARVIGASGAVAGVVLLYTLYYPRRSVYIWGILPIELRWLAAIFVVSNLLPLFSNDRTGVAHVVHLAGAAYGVLYKVYDLRFSRLLRGGFARRRLRWPPATLRRRPKVRVVVPPEEENMDRLVDQVLAKISRQGYASLTDDERRILEQASRHYKTRRQ